MAGTNGRVLIYGESGTGKELVGPRHPRAQPARRAAGSLEVNCAAIPEELIESELFGHIKASFTSAHETKIGKFQKADVGTLFLDEVGDMSLRTSPRCCACWKSSGSSRWARRIHAGGRALVAATNKHLMRRSTTAISHEDLFYRLKRDPLLRCRRCATGGRTFRCWRSFLREFTTAYGRKLKELTVEAYGVLGSITGRATCAS